MDSDRKRAVAIETIGEIDVVAVVCDRRFQAVARFVEKTAKCFTLCGERVAEGRVRASVLLSLSLDALFQARPTQKPWTAAGSNAPRRFWGGPDDGECSAAGRAGQLIPTTD